MIGLIFILASLCIFGWAIYQYVTIKRLEKKEENEDNVL